MKRIALVFAFALLAFVTVPAFAQDIAFTPVIPATNTPQPEDATLAVEPLPTPVVNGYAEPQPGLLDPANDKFEYVVLGVAVVASLIIVTLGSLVVVLSVMVYKSTPPSVQSAILYSRGWVEPRVNQATDKLVALAKSTPNELDDLLAGYIDTRVDAKVNEVYNALERIRAAQDTAAHG